MFPIGGEKKEAKHMGCWWWMGISNIPQCEGDSIQLQTGFI